MREMVSSQSNRKERMTTKSGQWYGYAGTILDVDLDREAICCIPLDRTMAREYMGGKGFGARYLFDQLPPHCDPLSPDNLLIFSTGTLTGTLVPASSRCVVCTKSPATGLWLDANCGGFFGPELKMAGFDAIIIRGRAKEPLILLIDDDDVRLQKASDIWGMDSPATHRWIKNHLGGAFRVASIGPAGERGVRFASIISEYRAFGRGGAGAVMGSKNLKAIAVRGSKSIPIGDPERFMMYCREAYNELAIHPETGGGRQKYGTNVILSCMNEAGIHPVRNFQKGIFDGAPSVNEENIREYFIRNKACFGCPIYCSKISEVKHGKYKGTFVEGPEYENVWAFGANCENTDIGAIIKAEYLCDHYGLDGISTGNVLGFLMECVEKGILREEDIGFTFRFGDGEGIIKAIHLIGRREGPGALWGEGVKRIAEKLEGAEDLAMHVKGLEMPAYDPRGSTGIALAYATSDRGGCHLRAWPIGAEFLSTEERMDPFSTEFKAEYVKSQQDLFTVIDSCGLCLFTNFALSLRQLTQFLHSATKMDIFTSSQEILKIGERINNLVRMFNLREGLTKEGDNLPERFLKHALEDGPCRGRVVDIEPMVREYYLVRGWGEDGIPTGKKMEELNLV
ncbi:MAG: aldehyde ferredoxin oxidoreductase family protein [Syntrophobacterales bacterium]|nr:MAG: aldehyde ferredoxin oxidoreductase family protein [Syntrophobacterales bacterium]